MNTELPHTEPYPETVLLQSVRVLHLRGAHRVQIYPHIYATGHWRCPIVIDGRDPYARDGLLYRSPGLIYSNAMEWGLPGQLGPRVPIDAETAADLIWAALTDEERDLAQIPDPDYVAWYAELLSRLRPGGAPYLFSDEDAPYRDGTIGGLGTHSDPNGGTGLFPLPPGNALAFLLDE